MEVTTWTLEMRARPARVREVPAEFRIEPLAVPTPTYVRFLYALVGGPWSWVDRLAWPQARWAEELDRPGAEVHVAYGGGEPAGYVQLSAVVGAAGTEVELSYFGLAEAAIGRGLGGALLAYGIDRAWTLPDRHELPAVTRVWVHTCTLDSPAALANYQARGFEIVNEETTHEDVPEQPWGAWRATTGLAT